MRTTAATHVTAILSGPQPVDGDSHLRTALSGLGVTVITADGPAATARAVASSSHSGKIALVDPRLAAHPHALRLALLDPRWECAHAPGVLVVTGAARERLAAELRAIPDLTAHRVDGTSPAARLTAPKPLLADEFADLLRAQGIAVHETALPPELVARLVAEPLSARKDVYAEIAAVDEESVRLRRAVKGDDGLFTTYCVSTWTRYLARWCARRGLTPNFVTTVSLLVAVAGAGAAATGTRAGYICTAVALYFSFALDCTDGQLARYSLQFSRIGSWLDATFDRAKEYAVYAGLALGAARGGGHDHGVWLLAAAAMVLQTLRHHIDFAYHESLRGQPAAEKPATAADAPRRSPGYWARKVVVLPIGERWALIAILTALSTPRVVFSVLLVWGVLAALYTTAGRVRRSLAGNGIRTEEAVDALQAMCDLPVMFMLNAKTRESLRGKLGWLMPPAWQAVSYLIILGLAVADQSFGAAVFAFLAAAIYHEYDIVYRIRANAGQPPRWLSLALGGNLGRALVLALLGLPFGGLSSTYRMIVWLLAAYLAVLAVGESVRFWTRPAAPVLPD